MVNSRLLLPVALLSLGLVFQASAADPDSPVGFLIFKDIPAMPNRDAKVIEFIWAEEFTQVVNYRVKGNPRQGRLFREKVPAVVRYPDFSKSTLTTPADFGELQKEIERLTGIAKEFPQTEDRIAKAKEELEATLETYADGQVLVNGRWINQDATTRPARDKGSYIDKMTVEDENGIDKTYYNVHVLTIEPDRVRITHSEGSAAIPHSKLPDELKELWKFKS